MSTDFNYVPSAVTRFVSLLISLIDVKVNKQKYTFSVRLWSAARARRPQLSLFTDPFGTRAVFKESVYIEMRLIILEDASVVADWAARFVMQRIKEFAPGPGRRFVLGLPTGGTPLGMYRRLIDFYREGRLSFEHVTTFNMDEYVGLPRDHPESYHHYMYNEFFKHVDIAPEHAHVLDGNASDLAAECARFERLIKEAGGVHLFVGGIGPDGHIAFNEPGSSLVSRTRVKTLAYDTLEANKRFFDNDISKVPSKALTVGVGTVMDAKEVMILITGAHKAPALSKAIEEGVNHMWTVSAFQQHPQALFVCDEDATLELRVKTVKYFKALSEEHQKMIEEVPVEAQQVIH